MMIFKKHDVGLRGVMPLIDSTDTPPGLPIVKGTPGAPGNADAEGAPGGVGREYTFDI